MAKITSKASYETVLNTVERLMQKGSTNVSKEELKEIKHLALAAQNYEQIQYTIPPPATLEGIIELKMFEKKLKQKQLAVMLKMSDTKLSQILSGKQKPDVAFLKAVHQQLDIDANRLLELV